MLPKRGDVISIAAAVIDINMNFQTAHHNNQ